MQKLLNTTLTYWHQPQRKKIINQDQVGFIPEYKAGPVFYIQKISKLSLLHNSLLKVKPYDSLNRDRKHLITFNICLMIKSPSPSQLGIKSDFLNLIRVLFLCTHSWLHELMYAFIDAVTVITYSVVKYLKISPLGSLTSSGYLFSLLLFNVVASSSQYNTK